MTAHVHDMFAGGFRSTKLIWAAIVLVAALAVTATVLALTSSSADSSATPRGGGGPTTVPSHSTNYDCGPTRIVHPC
jgi:hypothetical protein